MGVTGRTIPLVLLAGALCAGCGGGAAGQVPEDQVPSARAAAAEVAAGRCPQQEPLYVVNKGKGLDGSLVPVAASKLLVCHYDGLNDPHPLTLDGQATVTDQGSVGSWRKRFNALPKPRPGRMNCPNDDETALLAGFLGDHGAAVAVRVDQHGCQFASNGATARSAGASDGFIDDLNHLATAHR